ncbi:MAG: tetratricopeptide repeat protein [Myxococcota bacterium]
MTDWKKHLEHGWNALKNKEFQSASTHFMAAYIQNPDHPLACYAYGRELARAGQFAEAEPILKKAWDTSDNLVQAACEWARVKARITSDISSIFEFLNNLEKEFNNSVIIPLTRIELFLQQGRVKEAEYDYTKAVHNKADPKKLQIAKAKIEQLKGLKQVKKQNLAKAKTHFQKALELDQNWAGPVVNLGAVYEKEKNIKEAEKLYLKALDIEENHPVALYNLAKLLFEQKKTVQAAAYVKNLLQHHIDYPGSGELATKILE